MSFAAGAFSSGLRRGGGGGGGSGGGGGDGGARRLFNRIQDKVGQDGKDDSGGPSPIMGKLMMNAMVAMSPGGTNASDAHLGSANTNAKDDQYTQLNDIDKKNEMEKG